MPRFMLILSSPPELPAGYSPDQIQQTFQNLQAWIEDIRAEGRYVVSDKLKDEGGKIVSSRNRQITVTDGPFSESKEVIGGYFTIRAADYDEAVAIASRCPFLEFGRITVRQTDPMGCGGE